MWDWCRLIDDTLSKWPSKEEFLEFHSYINTLHPTVKWTYELEEDNKLAIFDILLIKDKDKLETTVYRKETSTNRYIHWTSAQSPYREDKHHKNSQESSFELLQQPSTIGRRTDQVARHLPPKWIPTSTCTQNSLQ